MSDLPLPVRLAAGLVVTALEQARTLPQQLAGLPMTVASRALQASMRAQQQITDMAIKGDAVFAQLRPVEEAPEWAHFDEDDDFSEPWGGSSGPTVNGTADIDIGADDSELTAVFSTTPSRPTPVTEIRESDVAKAASSANHVAVDGYPDMSLAQLRGKLRSLSLPELESLLDYENEHGQRPPFVTMLSNRITTVRAK